MDALMTEMIDYRVILKKVGIAWIAFGLTDIAFMIYSVAHGHSYSSSFNVFAVIAGVFLMRGSLRATTLVTWFSAFSLAGILGVFLIFLFLQPIGLLIVQAKLDPFGSTVVWLMTLAVLVLLGWSYKQLRSAPVLEARGASGRSTTTPRLAIALGVALVAILGVALNMTLNGAAGVKAVDLARKQFGPNYKYFAQSISTNGEHTRAVVAAYNDREIKYVPVEWNE
ncbi:MAG TPA: hypothetical protein VFI26_09865 [Lysobacter sp.]|jgi:hypothetical protein|nr:hypothetical protein [Lysobacter sp.]